MRAVVLSEIIREGAERHGDYDPTGLSQSAVLAHENDMEGALVVAEKPRSDLHGTRVVYVETLAHNKFFDMHLQVLPAAARTARSCSTTSIQFCTSSPRGMGSKPTVRG